MATTRAATRCPVFETTAKIPKAKLPSNRDILRYYEYVRFQLQYKTDNFEIVEPRKETVASYVIEKVKKRWIQASLGAMMIEDKSILKRILSLYDHEGGPCKSAQPYRCYKEIVNHLKFHRTIPESASSKEKMAKFHEHANRLFDISKCKTGNVQCKCSCCALVLKGDLEFLAEQRAERKLFIDFKVDRSGTDELQTKEAKEEKKQERKRKEQEAYQRQLSRSESEMSIYNRNAELEDSTDDENVGGGGNDVEMEYVPPKQENDDEAEVDLVCPIKTSVALGLSLAESIGMINATIEALAPFLQPSVRDCRITKSTFHRAKDAVLNQLMSDHLKGLRQVPITALYLDAKQDLTRNRVPNDHGTYSTVETKENHYTLISEPGSKYITTLANIKEPMEDGKKQKVKCLNYRFFVNWKFYFRLVILPKMSQRP